MALCSVKDCGNKLLARSLCSKHYWRLMEHGSTEDTNRTKPTHERFFDKILKTDHCWEWTANKNKQGYGKFRYRDGQLAHRYSYEYHNNVSLRSDQIIMHSCDNPSCVNPDHLSIGTPLDNARDRDLKGRWRHNGRKGEDMHNVKLNKELAIDIFLCQATYARTAEIYGVAVHDVADIKTGRRWAFATKDMERNTIEP